MFWHSYGVAYVLLLFHACFDRPDCPGGGVIVYVRDSLASKHGTDLEILGLEAVWVGIQTQSKTVLVGGFYRSPISNADYFTSVNESINILGQHTRYRSIPRF